MSNNQKRNWQRLMHDRADKIAEVCMMPMAGDPTETLRKRCREVYMQGYRDGRDSVKKSKSGE